MDVVGVIVPAPGNYVAALWPNGTGRPDRSAARPVRSGAAAGAADNEAVRLVLAMLDHASGREPRWNTKYAQTMVRVVDELLTRHEYVFSGMVRKLKASCDNWSDAATPAVLARIIDEMFADGVYNWGRVCSVYALLVRVVQQLRADDDGAVESLPGAEALAAEVGRYVNKRLGGRIEQLGDWDAFVENFPSPTAFEDGLRRGLLWTAVVGAVGIVAVTAASRLS